MAAAEPAPAATVQFDETSLQILPGISYEEWAAQGEGLQLYARASCWWLGDWLLYGDKRFGEDRASAAVDLSGLEYSSVTATRWVASKIEPARRHAGLSWSHHREVAALPPAEQDRLLDLAEIDGLNRAELRDLVKDGRVTLDSSPGSALTEQPGDAPPNPTEPGTAGASSDNVVALPARARSMTEGYDDSPEFLEACRLRFGPTKGAEVWQFTTEWVRRHAPKAIKHFE